MGNTENKSAVKSGSTKDVLGVIGNVVLWIFLVIAAIITVMALSTTAKDSGGIPNIFGYSFVSVQSDSMKPEFVTGDLVIIKKLDTDAQKNLEIGDVITFTADIMKSDGTPGQDGTSELNTHRIIEKYEKGDVMCYKTQGDANVLDDDYEVLSGTIVGKYQKKISNGGKVMDFLRSQLGFLLCIVLPLVIFFIFKIYRLIVIIVSRRNKELTEAEQEELKRKGIEEYLAAQKAQEAEEAPAKASEETPDPTAKQ